MLIGFCANASPASQEPPEAVLGRHPHSPEEGEEMWRGELARPYPQASKDSPSVEAAV